jgi:hypothetical protein
MSTTYSLIANRKEVQTRLGVDAIIVYVLVRHANPLVKLDRAGGISTKQEHRQRYIGLDACAVGK